MIWRRRRHEPDPIADLDSELADYRDALRPAHRGLHARRRARPGWSSLDPLILLVLRGGPVRPRDLRGAVKEVDSVAPDEVEVASSLGQLRGTGLVRDDGDRLALTDEGRAMVTAAVGDRFWDEWERLRTALETLPLPRTRDV